jgi:hypothetical protein
MESKDMVKNDSERSDDEKIVTSQDEESNKAIPYTHDLPADPDAHLSAEERAKIVSQTSIPETQY